MEHSLEPIPGLPLSSAGLPGTGGRIKSQPSDFVVEEIALYEPCGAGGHVYLSIRREGRTTRDLTGSLARLFDLDEREIGCAGLKDKVAIVTQTFSLPLGDGEPDAIAARVRDALGVEVLRAARHGNKLRRGHLIGNRFDVRIVEPVPDALARAQGIAAALSQNGVPNFFAEQRLGPGGRNARRGRARLDAPRSSWIARFELSAWQSELFNAWLADRASRGRLGRVLAGDVAKKRDTGGLFEVEDETANQPRCERGEISATGPIYGTRMRWARGEPGDLERAILAQAGVDEALLARARLSGSRRVARVYLEDFVLSATDGDLRLSFRLPKGAYATNALREFVKPGPGTRVPEEAGD